jgi:pimeloyl-ACP methyl ester carboxylesterase
MTRLLWQVLAACLLLIVAGLAMFYIVDGQPLPESNGFLEGSGYSAARRDDGGWLFSPAQPNGRGLLIMHGALIKPQSYANTAAFFAARGYTVLLPHGGVTRLPIMAVERAAGAMRELGVQEWFSIGHSMGGMASLSLMMSHPELPITAGALWASGIPSDYSGVEVPLLFLWGDRDDILPEGRFAGAKSKLPSGVEYVTVQGANHRDFAMYGHQFFDGEGELGWRAQIDTANRRTLAFFDQHTGQ